MKSHGFDFAIVKADIDERALGDRTFGADPETLVQTLAHAKADAIIKSLPLSAFENRNVLLTADQVVVHRGHILEKPHSINEAREFINSYSGDCCSTVGSLVLTDLTTMKRVEGTDRSTIYFQSFPSTIIQQILDEGHVLHCAGGLMVEHELLQPYVKQIEGSQDSLMGLSIPLLQQLLDQLLSTTIIPVGKEE